ncbi:MAG: hypothetical protein HYZ50_15690 [Deltaproteobacteria bacterium]|nr:hypothetical protein [Deltaproteobacteria bacterium]
MKADVALEALSSSELIALIHELRQQLAEREQEIERLTELVPKEKPTSVPSEQDRDAAAVPEPGTQEDLLAQLEREYPEG